MRSNNNSEVNFVTNIKFEDNNEIHTNILANLAKSKDNQSSQKRNQTKFSSFSRYQQPQSLKQLRQSRIRTLIEENDKQENIFALSKVLNTSQEKFATDKKSREVRGQTAIKDYNFHYKNLKRVKEENQLFQQEQSAFTAMLAKSIEKQILPSKVGVVKTAGAEDILDVSHYKFGDNYIQVMGEGIAYLQKLKHLKLDNNRISDTGAISFLQNLSKNIKILDLSDNVISKIGCESIGQLLMKRDCRIEELNLENNRLGNANVQIILDTLVEKNLSIKKLNLSKNYISNVCCEVLSEVILKNQYLTELYLHWNHIQAKGGGVIFTSLIENDTIKVIDLSWNTLGQSRLGTCINQLVFLLTENKIIIHLDLSNNNFNREESIQISQALTHNQTLMGVHFQGNYGYIDHRGFLIVDNNTLKDQHDQLNNTRIDSTDAVGRIRKRELGQKMKNVCWLCEGWQETDLTWTLIKSGYDHKGPGFVYVDFVEFVGEYLGDQLDMSYPIQMMMPPGNNYLFYGFNHRQVLNKEYRQVSSSLLTPLMKRDREDMKEERVQLKKINVIELGINKELVGLGYSVNFGVVPRTKGLSYVPAVRKEMREKIEWTLGSSLFKDYVDDNEELLNKCFEADWSNMRVTRLVKDQDDLNKVKEVLRNHYRLYKACYKSFASLNPVGEVFAIQNHEYQQFVDQVKLIDNDFIRQQEIQVKFVATNSNQEMKKNKQNPERGLIRHEFSECLVRIAEEKFIKSGKVNNYFEAVSKLYDEHLLDFMKVFPQEGQRWRREVYWNENCELVLLKYRTIVLKLFEIYSVKNVKPGQKKFVCPQELMDLAKNAELFQDQKVIFQESDVSMSYNLSMMTQVDEINDPRIFKMSPIEFYESIARMADKISLPRIGMHNISMASQDRLQQPLHYKMESLLHHLYHNCLSFEMKKEIPIKEDSIFDQELRMSTVTDDDMNLEEDSVVGIRKKFQNIVDKTTLLSKIIPLSNMNTPKQSINISFQQNSVETNQNSIAEQN